MSANPGSRQSRNDICGVVCAAGRHGEPLACTHPKGHKGKHSWASLPTFANGVAVEDVERAARLLETLKVSPPEARGHFGNAAAAIRHVLFRREPRDAA